MKRFLAILAAFSLLIAACGGGNDSIVATVDGHDISRDDVQQLVPDTEADVSATEFARYLSLVIQWEAVAGAAATEFGIEVSEAEIDDRVEELVASDPNATSIDEYVAAVGATEFGLRAFARQLVIQDGVEESLAEIAEQVSDAEVNAQLVDTPLDWTVVCVSHVLVETEEEAAAVLDRLDAGEDFATIAQEVSLDTGTAENGGDLGCGSPAQYVGPFAAATVDAEVGVPTGPVETEFGFHVVDVAQREVATPEVVRDTLAREILANDVSDWFNSLIVDIDVTVDEEVGVWVTDPTPQVLANN
ncbi:MAG: peptidylprolyl isomerase [Actinomycetota bacterium]